MIAHRFHPTQRIALLIIVPSMLFGLGLGVLDDLRSDSDVDFIAAGFTLLTGALLLIPALAAFRWYGRVMIDSTGVSARDTLGRWRTVPWDSMQAVRKVGPPGIRFILLSSAGSRWSVWLAERLEPRDALLTALSEAGPRAAAIRAEFAGRI